MTNEEATIDITAAQSRGLQEILGPAPVESINKIPQTPLTHPPALNRKPRSDKGVPKKPAAAATLTIQFDLSDNEGRELFAKTLKFWAENGAMEAVKQIAEQFAKKVDAISRAK